MGRGLRFFRFRDRLPRGLTLAAGVFFLLAPAASFAEGISGTADLTYSRLNTATRSSTGDESGEEIRSFMQLYTLNLSKSIFPLLKLSVGGTLQKNASDIIMNDTRNSAITTLTRPYVDIKLGNPFLSLGARYDRITTEGIFQGVRAPVVVRDSYHGFLGWKPSDLPSLDATATRTHTYDRARASEDILSDQFTLTSRYSPSRKVQLQYLGALTDANNRITELETRIQSHDGRVTYDDRFFDNRVSFSTYYDAGYGVVDTSVGGTGTQNVPFQVFALDGLFIASDTPELVQLVSTPFLTDNDVSGTGGGAINIGSAPSSAVPPNTAARNIGLRFGAATEINRLLLWVNSGTGFLTASVAASYTWQIYTSTDNLNWTLYQAVSAPYTPYVPLPGTGSFEILFPNVKAQYLKVVVSPLAPVGEGLLFPNVFVTELQAFIQKPASEVRGTTRGLNQQFTAAGKVNILNAPHVFYDVSYFLYDNSSAGTAVRRSTLTNGLSLLHRFSPVLSTTARAERADDVEPEPLGRMVTYTYSVSLLANPLPTLRDSLTYGLTIRELSTGREKTQSLYSSNTAEVYRNVSAFLNAGLSRTEADVRTDSTTFSYGLSMVPLKTMSLILSATDQKLTQTTPEGEQPSRVLRREQAGLSYTPFSTLYLTAGASRVAQGSLRYTTQTYGVNWSPFPGGALQFNVGYSEDTSTQNGKVTRIQNQSLRWVISRWASAYVSYVTTDDKSDTGQSETRGVTLNFRAVI